MVGRTTATWLVAQSSRIELCNPCGCTRTGFNGIPTTYQSPGRRAAGAGAGEPAVLTDRSFRANHISGDAPGEVVVCHKMINVPRSQEPRRSGLARGTASKRCVTAHELPPCHTFTRNSLTSRTSCLWVSISVVTGGSNLGDNSRYVTKSNPTVFSPRLTTMLPTRLLREVNVVPWLPADGSR